MSSANKAVIGGASGFWGEASHATRQLLETGRLDYLVYDYLAEVTMSIMARARAKDAKLGFATDFVSAALAPNLEEIATQQIKVISNAGGVNPLGCAAALEALIAERGLDLTVATVTGDDLIDKKKQFADAGITEMFSAAPFPALDTIASINAYLGAFPIAQALNAGADIVITGRCVDSAVTLAACIHKFGWTPEDYDHLSAGSLAGHLLECGPQATGGNFTDWREAGDLSKIGYPMVEMEADGTFSITKPPGTSGVVSPLSVGEQLLYEIGDPQAYLLPDVTCDFSEATLTQSGADQVTVSNAKGRPPNKNYKVSLTHADGYRAGQLLTFQGLEVHAKAKAFSDAVFERSRSKLRAANAGDYQQISFEIVGGIAPDNPNYGEIVAKIAAQHARPEAIGVFLKELTGMALATPPGMSVFAAAGRPRPSPVVRLFSFLVEKNDMPVSVHIGGNQQEAEIHLPSQGARDPSRPIPPPLPTETDDRLIEVPLSTVAVGRSGDKGNHANIGIMARDERLLPWIWQHLTEDRVAEVFAEFLEGRVERYYLPGSHSINFLLENVLGGGGMASLRMDAQGKAYAQMLLATLIEIPETLVRDLKRSGGAE